MLTSAFRVILLFSLEVRLGSGVVQNLARNTQAYGWPALLLSPGFAWPPVFYVLLLLPW